MLSIDADTSKQLSFGSAKIMLITYCLYKINDRVLLQIGDNCYRVHLFEENQYVGKSLSQKLQEQQWKKTTEEGEDKGMTAINKEGNDGADDEPHREENTQLMTNEGHDESGETFTVTKNTDVRRREERDLDNNVVGGD